MKISLLVAAGIAVVAAKKPKRTKSEIQDAKERGVGDVDESMFEKCGGKPTIPANANDVDCWLSWKGDSVWCEAVCQAGYRLDSGKPDKARRAGCYLDHPKESRRKFGKELGPCVPLCPDMDEALKTLSSNVHVEREVRGGWRQDFYGVPMIKFACIDKRDQLTVKGRFQNLFHRFDFSQGITDCKLQLETILFLLFLIKLNFEIKQRKSIPKRRQQKIGTMSLLS